LPALASFRMPRKRLSRQAVTPSAPSDRRRRHWGSPFRPSQEFSRGQDRPPMTRRRLQPWRPRNGSGHANAYFSLARRCLAGWPNSSMKCTPSPRAIFSIIKIVGFARLFSIRLIAACSTCVTAASSSCVQPRSFRSRRTFAASVRDTAELRAGNRLPNPDRAIAPRSVKLSNSVYVIYHIFTGCRLTDRKRGPATLDRGLIRRLQIRPPP
jgi:hypothetical protein